MLSSKEGSWCNFYVAFIANRCLLYDCILFKISHNKECCVVLLHSLASTVPFADTKRTRGYFYPSFCFLPSFNTSFSHFWRKNVSPERISVSISFATFMLQFKSICYILRTIFAFQFEKLLYAINIAR